MPKLNLKDIDDLKIDDYPQIQKIRRKKPKKDENLQADKVRRKK